MTYTYLIALFTGNSIIAFLETAEQDYSRLLAEEETSESEAVAAYDKFMQESKVTVAKKTAEKKGKESEIKSLKVALGNHKEDYASTNKELDAVMEYLAKLKEHKKLLLQVKGLEEEVKSLRAKNTDLANKTSGPHHGAALSESLEQHSAVRFETHH